MSTSRSAVVCASLLQSMRVPVNISRATSAVSCHSYAVQQRRQMGVPDRHCSSGYLSIFGQFAVPEAAVRPVVAPSCVLVLTDEQPQMNWTLRENFVGNN